ncbi:magnesium transporter MgtE N-terminal domain-containing protein [Nonomuraea endophytica]|uniref:Flagellar motility protein MotE (MotC chaperone)/sporulation protein YlmC with PRC-barrel domain n=1 Tax=Nonomuraea endophytica TaxID=714136 RepID=A0A7W8EHI5_9ACTN|nr:CBS domain-containing protein [Nonomuraea endophytica]MBB5080995.1 flagellar motility protein MotE (MotC chaperone)/sporulation protein YlmC with PRC-barrel domain [Nonomuraea endophytica]
MRIFVARLAGTPVFDPSGDQIGRVRDVVVSLRPTADGTLPPRVHGLVVEVQPRRRVFLPITRVRGIETGAVIFSGRLNMRRFEQRVTETLTIGQLLDQTVTLDGRPWIVYDLAMEQGRSEWTLTKVAVYQKGKRRETRVVDWGDVRGFDAMQRDQGAAGLIAAFETERAADLANALHELPFKRRVEVAAELGDERLADVLEELPFTDQIGILTALAPTRAAVVLSEMGPDDAADLLQDLPDDQAAQLLSLMEPGEAAPVRRLLDYDEDTAGGMMTSEPVVLPPSATVAEALAHIRQRDLSPAVAAQVYVTRAPTETPTGAYLGVAHFQRLLRERPSMLLGAALDHTIDPIRPGFTLPEVTSYLATYNLVAAPVVDEGGRLVGAVTVDDVLDHLLPEDWRERHAT